MEMEGSSKGPERLILRCADDEGNLMCFICCMRLPSAKTLYNHLKSSSCYYRWRSVLPKKLSDCSTVVVLCHTLPLITPDSHSHSSIKQLEEEGECKRARQHIPDHAPNKSKVVADAPNSTNVNHRVVAEAVGKVVLDFDLNEPAMMELADDQ